MIIGTAGHIDHGKSALITALTGRPMDRLAEERRRGITIDLNFAPLDLGQGRVAGVVDVPGHEDFVRTMVAGASGIDLALLVIAADEGIMPQTEEHLAILEYLGIPAGIPVITKADLADAEWLDLVTLEVAERLARSAMAFEAPVAVSAKTGQGLDLLRERLTTRISSVAARPQGDAFRLPVDRAFSVAGVGTVVTGTAWSGGVAVGDAVRILPRGEPGRVRSVETFGHAVDRSHPGARTALGIAGVDRAAVRRGDVVITDELPWSVVTALDVEIALHPQATRPLLTRSRVRLHLGTAELMARVLPRTPIEPGGTGIARLSLEQPAVARGGDRFVLRSYSPVTTIGGGWVLDPMPPRRRSSGSAGVATRNLAPASPGRGNLWPAGLAAREPGERFRALLARRPGGIEVATLPILLGLPKAAAEEVARAEPAARKVGEHWIGAEVLQALAARALALVRRFHREQKSERGMRLETLRHSLRAPDWQVEAALADLAQAHRLRTADGLAALAGFSPKVEGGDAELERIVGILVQAHLTPPSLAELERQTGRRDLNAILRLAAARGKVEAVGGDRYYAREALDRFVEVLTELGHAQDIVPGAIRDRLGISRKYLIPLLEWADVKGITVREGDARRLRRSHPA